MTMRALACLAALVFAGCTPAAPSAPSSASSGEPAARVKVTFSQSGITSVLAEGFADLETARPVTEDDPVRVASISKLVTAIGVMRMVEAGQLNLDQDVSEVLGWRLRHPGFPDTPITLRLLLSHRSGVTDAAGYGSPFDVAIRDRMSNPGAWDPDHGPGVYFRYANLNYPLVATIMETAAGERFDQLMDRLVLRPLRLEACFNWAMCPEPVAARAVVLYNERREPLADNNKNAKPDCPVTPAEDGGCDLSTLTPGQNGGAFAPQGGLRISARGLSIIGRMILNGGEVDGIRLLSPASIDMLFTPVWTYDGRNGETYDADTADPGGALFCRYGLGTQILATPSSLCRDDPFGDRRERIGHPGEAYGLVSGLWLDRASGTGVAYFITGADLKRYGKNSAFYADEETLLAETPE
ncbi:MAG: beta-lactamase family protein [Alphaproteobacteria bacterium]|nr:beta-lactamase family protein [Alphaproteobacteria bacterium]